MPEMSIKKLSQTLFPELKEIPAHLHVVLESECVYSDFLEHQSKDIESFRKNQGLEIGHLDFSKLQGKRDGEQLVTKSLLLFLTE